MNPGFGRCLLLPMFPGAKCPQVRLLSGVLGSSRIPQDHHQSAKHLPVRRRIEAVEILLHSGPVARCPGGLSSLAQVPFFNVGTQVIDRFCVSPAASPPDAAAEPISSSTGAMVS